MENTLLEGDIKKTFFQYLIPSIGGMLGTAGYVIGDTIIIGKALGGQGLAALNMVLPLFRLINGVGLLFGVGGATILSILRGKGQEERINDIFNMSLILSSILGFILLFLRLYDVDSLVKILGSTSYTYDMVRDYLDIFLYFAIFTILNVTLGVFVRNDGSPKLVMTATLASAAFNLILDYILVFPYKMGMWGAAFATAVSPVLSICILLFHFILKRNKISFKWPKFETYFIKRIIKTGIPSFILEFSVGIVIYLFNITLIKISGDLSVAVYGIIINWALFANAIFNGIGQAIQPIVSINHGAGKVERTLEAGKLGVLTGLILGVAFYVSSLVFPNFYATVFTNERGEIITMANRAIKIYFSAYLIIGVNMAMISYIQSKEQIKSSTIISLLRGSIYVIILLIILSRTMGLDGVWLTIPLAEVLAFITSIFAYKECKNLIKYTFTGKLPDKN